ncbi:MAG: hypothetical protein AB1609_09145 [Bacillota bacterium]
MRRRMRFVGTNWSRLTIRKRSACGFVLPTFVIVRNPEEAERDQKKRASIVAELDQRLKRLAAEVNVPPHPSRSG